MGTGTKYVGPIHGRLMTFTSLAAFAGPTFLLSMRNMSEASAMKDLLANVDPARFQEVFNTKIEDAQMLIDVRFCCNFLAMFLALCCSYKVTAAQGQPALGSDRKGTVHTARWSKLTIHGNYMWWSTSFWQNDFAAIGTRNGDSRSAVC